MTDWGGAMGNSITSPQLDFRLSHVMVRLQQMKAMREKWRADPEYIKTLDMDIAGLQLLIRELVAQNVQGGGPC
jgi:hypothetical protein